MMVTWIQISMLMCLGWGVLAAADPAPGSLRVSENNRFLVTESGEPFFWLGDTAWELFHRLNREEADRYLRDRADKGFTIIQAVALAELGGLVDPNPYGHLPLMDSDPARPLIKDGPDNDYWDHVDWVVDRANTLGLVVGFLPTWGDKWNKKWGMGPEIFTPQNAEVYGRWLGKRYRTKSLVWIVGGDRPIEKDGHRTLTEAMARGLRAGDGGAHLITFHPTGGRGSAEWFHDAEWLDFNMRQNGHDTAFTGGYAGTLEDYQRTPVKPVIDGEPIYEDHPVSFRPKDNGHSMTADIRRPLYWDLFSGAFGHTYGHHSIWQMWQPGRNPVNFPLMPWHQAIAQPGSEQMQHARWLLESRPFLSRIPDDSVIVPDEVVTAVPGAGRYRLKATRDADGTYAMVYTPSSRPFNVRLDVIKGPRVTAWWFNPRDGSANKIGTWPSQGECRFAPPTPGEMLDWVLVLDDAEADYGPPGGRAGSRMVR